MIGQYLENDILLSQIEVHLGKGRMELKRFQLRASSLNSFINDCPLKVGSAFVGKLCVEIAYNNIFEDSCSFFFEDIRIELIPTTEAPLSEDSPQAPQATLPQNNVNVLKSEQAFDAANQTENLTFLADWVAQITSKMKVSVKDLNVTIKQPSEALSQLPALNIRFSSARFIDETQAHIPQLASSTTRRSKSLVAHKLITFGQIEVFFEGEGDASLCTCAPGRICLVVDNQHGLQTKYKIDIFLTSIIARLDPLVLSRLFWLSHRLEESSSCEEAVSSDVPKSDDKLGLSAARFFFAENFWLFDANATNCADGPVSEGDIDLVRLECLLQQYVTSRQRLEQRSLQPEEKSNVHCPASSIYFDAVQDLEDDSLCAHAGTGEFTPKFDFSMRCAHLKLEIFSLLGDVPPKAEEGCRTSKNNPITALQETEAVEEGCRTSKNNPITALQETEALTAVVWSEREATFSNNLDWNEENSHDLSDSQTFSDCNSYIFSDCVSEPLQSDVVESDSRTSESGLHERFLLLDFSADCLLLEKTAETLSVVVDKVEVDKPGPTASLLPTAVLKFVHKDDTLIVPPPCIKVACSWPSHAQQAIQVETVPMFIEADLSTLRNLEHFLLHQNSALEKSRSLLPKYSVKSEKVDKSTPTFEILWNFGLLSIFTPLPDEVLNAPWTSVLLSQHRNVLSISHSHFAQGEKPSASGFDFEVRPRKLIFSCSEEKKSVSFRGDIQLSLVHLSPQSEHPLHIFSLFTGTSGERDMTFSIEYQAKILPSEQDEISAVNSIFQDFHFFEPGVHLDEPKSNQFNNTLSSPSALLRITFPELHIAMSDVQLGCFLEALDLIKEESSQLFLANKSLQHVPTEDKPRTLAVLVVLSSVNVDLHENVLPAEKIGKEDLKLNSYALRFQHVQVYHQGESLMQVGVCASDWSLYEASRNSGENRFCDTPNELDKLVYTPIIYKTEWTNLLPEHSLQLRYTIEHPSAQTKLQGFYLDFCGMTLRYRVETQWIDRLRTFFSKEPPCKPVSCAHHSLLSSLEKNPSHEKKCSEIEVQEVSKCFLSLRDCSVDYCPAGAVSRFVTVIGCLKVSANFVPDARTQAIKITLYDFAVYVVNRGYNYNFENHFLLGKSPPPGFSAQELPSLYMETQNSNQEYLESKEFARVATLNVLDLVFRAKMGHEDEPRVEIEIWLGSFNLYFCADSLWNLTNLLDHWYLRLAAFNQPVEQSLDSSSEKTVVERLAVCNCLPEQGDISSAFEPKENTELEGMQQKNCSENINQSIFKGIDYEMFTPKSKPAVYSPEKSTDCSAKNILDGVKDCYFQEPEVALPVLVKTNALLEPDNEPQARWLPEDSTWYESHTSSAPYPETLTRNNELQDSSIAQENVSPDNLEQSMVIQHEPGWNQTRYPWPSQSDSWEVRDTDNAQVSALTKEGFATEITGTVEVDLQDLSLLPSFDLLQQSLSLKQEKRKQILSVGAGWNSEWDMHHYPKISAAEETKSNLNYLRLREHLSQYATSNESVQNRGTQEPVITRQVSNISYKGERSQCNPFCQQEESTLSPQDEFHGNKGVSTTSLPDLKSCPQGSEQSLSYLRLREHLIQYVDNSSPQQCVSAPATINLQNVFSFDLLGIESAPQEPVHETSRKFQDPWSLEIHNSNANISPKTSQVNSKNGRMTGNENTASNDKTPEKLVVVDLPLIKTQSAAVQGGKNFTEQPRIPDGHGGENARRSISSQEQNSVWYGEGKTSPDIFNNYIPEPSTENVIWNEKKDLNKKIKVKVMLHELCLKVRLFGGNDWEPKSSNSSSATKAKIQKESEVPLKKKAAKEDLLECLLENYQDTLDKKTKHKLSQYIQVPNKTRIKQRRRTSEMIEFNFDKVKARFVSYCEESVEKDSCVSRFEVRCSEISVFDSLASPVKERKCLSRWYETNSRAAPGLDSAYVELRYVKPTIPANALSIPPNECQLEANVQPFQCWIDRSLIVFLQCFFSNIQPTQDMSQEEIPLGPPPVFFQFCRISGVRMRLDYSCTEQGIDLVAFQKGDYTELLNLVPLEKVELNLHSHTFTGISGWPKLIKLLLESWVADITTSQLHRFVFGITPIRPFVSVGKEAANLVMLPVSEYRKDGRVLRAVRLGAQAFVKTATLEMLNISHRATKCAASILGDLMGASSEPGSDPRSQIEYFDEQPAGFVEGLTDGFESLSREMASTIHTVIALPIQEYKRTGAGGTARCVIRALPIAVLKPIVGASEALSCTLLGVRNNLDPRSRQEEEELWRKNTLNF